MRMTWSQIAAGLRVLPDERGWLTVTRRLGGAERTFVVQRVELGAWELAVVQTSIAGEAQLSPAEAATSLARYPLGALVFNDGYWVLRQALALEGLTVEHVELTLRALDFEARQVVPMPVRGSETQQLFAHYAD